MRYFIVAVSDSADLDVIGIADALEVAGFRRTVRSGVQREFDVREAHFVQTIIPMTVHTFAAEIDLERE